MYKVYTSKFFSQYFSQTKARVQTANNKLKQTKENFAQFS